MTRQLPGLDVSFGHVAIRSAVFSDCGKYRYTLRRRWQLDGDDVAFIGLNPSTADAINDDPTIRRCIGFAKLWGYAGLHMLNLFSWRATKPAAMKQAAVNGSNIVGPDNDAEMRVVLKNAARIVCCWGSHGGLLDRDAKFLREVIAGAPVHCLGLTKDGRPRHPLFVKGDARLVRFQGGAK